MDKNYSIKLRAETITQNTRLTEVIYGSWLAQNIGSAPVTVFGIELLPGEGLPSSAICQLNPGDRWEEPIEITVQTGGAVRMLRSQAKEIKKDDVAGLETIPMIGGLKRRNR